MSDGLVFATQEHMCMDMVRAFKDKFYTKEITAENASEFLEDTTFVCTHPKCNRNCNAQVFVDVLREGCPHCFLKRCENHTTMPETHPRIKDVVIFYENTLCRYGDECRFGDACHYRHVKTSKPKKNKNNESFVEFVTIGNKTKTENKPTKMSYAAALLKPAVAAEPSITFEAPLAKMPSWADQDEEENEPKPIPVDLYTALENCLLAQNSNQYTTFLEEKAQIVTTYDAKIAGVASRLEASKENANNALDALTEEEKTLRHRLEEIQAEKLLVRKSTETTRLELKIEQYKKKCEIEISHALLKLTATESDDVDSDVPTSPKTPPKTTTADEVDIDDTTAAAALIKKPKKANKSPQAKKSPQ